ncbi:unnamed protein product [Closterium sp. NIES-53]
MDAEMASWKSVGSYVDAVPPSRANIVDGMWIFRVKRPPGSPPAFKACYVARGFSQRQGVDYFHTFSPTPKMTTLRMLLHLAAQRDYKLHSLDFSTAFLQGSLHEEIWLRRPPGFTGTFPLSKVVSCPKAFHLQAPKRVLKFLKGCVESGIFFFPARSEPQVELVGFSDADYAGDSANHRSHTGYVYCLNGAAISWQRKRQLVVALSTTESEHISLCQCIQEGVWLKRLFGEFGHEFAGGVPAFVDDQSVIALA